MSTIGSSGKPQSRRYTPGQKEWVKQAEIDAGVTPGATTAEHARIEELDPSADQTMLGSSRV